MIMEFASAITTAMLIGGAALVMAVLPLVRLMFRININTAMFAKMLKKLVAADNVDRAIKLCNAVPHVPVAKGAKGVLKLYQQRVSDGRTLADEFERSAGGVKKVVSKYTWSAYLALATAAGGAFVIFSSTEPPQAPEMILCGAAAFVAILVIRQDASIRRATKKLCDQLIADLQERILLS
jgi:hypothetical protein